MEVRLAVSPTSEAIEATEEEDEFSEPLHVPPSERKLVTQPYDLSLSSLQADIAAGRLLLNIEYQRRYVWDRSKASRLIESFLLNIPVPVCYFAENEDGSYEVIDGRQRIQTINDYLNNVFELTGISVLVELNGARYVDLDPRDARRLKNRTLRCIVITEDSHPDIKFDVFERLNTGSAILAAQELRNCIYRGDLNQDLKRIAARPWFTGILGGLQNQRMAYEELALRFFALRADIVGYSPPIRQTLNEYMRKNRLKSVDVADAAMLERTCISVSEIFGDTAFRAGSSRALNKALFDSIMIPISYSDTDSLVEKAAEVRDMRETLLEDSTFVSYIGRATADRNRMHGRIGMFADRLRMLGVNCDVPTKLA